MSARAAFNGRVEPGTNRALMDAVDAIADMARRVQLNGPEIIYASEKLGHALYKAAEGLALCAVQIDEVTAEACRGHEHGSWLAGSRQEGSGAPVPFVIHPVSREDARLRVTSVNGAVVLIAAHGRGAAGIQLSANETRVLANVLTSTARRLDGTP